MTDAEIDLRGLLALGRHPISELRLDLELSSDLGRWLLVASLLAGRVDPARALGAALRLRERGLDATDRLAKTEAAELFPTLGAARYPAPERAAARLVRIARGVEESRLSLGCIARDSDGLDELGGRLVRLSPGLGAATVSLFLRPLRDVWPAAAEIPLHPAARAAALHLGLIAEGEDLEGAPGALSAALRGMASTTPFADVEWALERLGRKSCARDRPEKCPLGDSCPSTHRAGIGVSAD